MHICYFCSTRVGGDYFRQLAHGMTELGNRVTVVELGKHNPPSWIAYEPNVEYRSLDISSRIEYPFAAVRLSRFLTQENVKVLHSSLYDAGLIARLAKHFTSKTKFIYTRHHSDLLYLIGTRIHRWIDRWMAQRMDGLIAVSDAVRSVMVKKDGITKPIKVIYLGFDFEKFSPNENERAAVRTEFAFNAEDIVVGYIASLVKAKGHKELFAAFALIAESNHKAKLFFVGGGQLPELEQEIRNAGLVDRVVFSGWRDDAASCLNAMDIFVQPSLSEAFSQVLVEAMGSGLPVIATRVGGAEEVITNGENGILIEPNDPISIAREVDRLARNPELRTSLGQTARSSVVERFSVERMVESHIAMYRELALR